MAQFLFLWVFALIPVGDPFSFTVQEDSVAGFPPSSFWQPFFFFFGPPPFIFLLSAAGAVDPVELLNTPFLFLLLHIFQFSLRRLLNFRYLRIPPTPRLEPTQSRSPISPQGTFPCTWLFLHDFFFPTRPEAGTHGSAAHHSTTGFFGSFFPNARLAVNP